jgi:hypothetical protein
MKKIQCIIMGITIITLFTLCFAGCVRDEEPELVKEKFQVGEEYQGGIIAYVDEGGEHGFIATAEDISTGIKWYNGSHIRIYSIDSSIGSGKYNTEKIVKEQGSGNYAAKLCDDLVLNDYDDWFLPSIDELQKLYNNRNKIGGFDENGFYWSSTENNSNDDNSYRRAQCIDFSTGQVRYYGKEQTLRVRAIRYF